MLSRESNLGWNAPFATLLQFILALILVEPKLSDLPVDQRTFLVLQKKRRKLLIQMVRLCKGITHGVMQCDWT